jgi:GTP-binding nuclear protein Ran
MIFFDVTSVESYRSVAKWHSDLVRLCPNIPVVLVGNKIDVRERKIPVKRVCFHRKHDMTYCEISAKGNYQVELPLLSLARQLLDAPDLQFTTPLRLPPPECEIDPELPARYKAEITQSEPDSPQRDDADWMA